MGKVNFLRKARVRGRRRTLLAILILLTAIGLFWFDRLQTTDRGYPANQNSSEELSRSNMPHPESDDGQTVKPPTTRQVVETDWLGICVIDCSGQPLTGAPVLLGRGSHIVYQSVTNQSGRVECPAVEPETTVYVLRGTTVRHQESLPRGWGDHTLTLSPLAALGGRVLVDGREPQRELTLKLYSDPTSGLLEAPEAVFAALGRRGDGHASFFFETDEFGVFHIDGLPARWSGTVEFPRGYVASHGGDHIRISAPQLGLVLNAHILPAIIGRVVDPDGAPVPGARVRYDMTGTEGSEYNETRCGSDGRFRIEFSCGSVQKASMFVSSPEVGSCVREVADIDEAAGVDLGDIALIPAKNVEFRVQTEDGMPIGGAIAQSVDGAAIQSEPSDADGWGTVPLLPFDQERLEVSALAFASREVSVPADRSQIVEVVLNPFSNLSILVRTAEGAPLPGIWVSLSIPSFFAFDADPPNHPDEQQVELGASSARMVKTWNTESIPGGQVLAVYETDGRGEVFITGLATGLSVTVKVQDPTGMQIAPEQIVRIDGAHTADLAFIVDREPLSCEVEVTDEHGHGLDQAIVWVEAGGDSLTQRRTNALGVVRLGNLFNDHIALSAGLSGYVTSRVEAQLATEALTRVEVVLRKGTKVGLKVVDQAGREAVVESAEALVDGLRVGGVWRLSPSSFELRDLPDAALVLRAKVGGKWFQQSSDKFVDSATIRVPLYGSLRVECGIASLDPDVRYVVVLESVDNEKFESRLTARSADIESGLHFPVVFPGKYKVQVSGISDNGTTVEAAPTVTVVVDAEHESVVVLAPR